MDLRPLIPVPKVVQGDPGPWRPGPLATPSASLAAPGKTAWKALAATLERVAPAGSTALQVVFRTDPGLESEGYRLVAGEAGVTIDHGDDAGAAHALRTLEQWVRVHAARNAEELPGLAVHDWPDLAERGVMLDISRDRVPRTDQLHALVEQLASWKCNRLQLYMEAAFAHSAFEHAWEGSDPFTADELRALDAHCAAHGIELVPNQQSFGHLHRFLVHEEWRAIAECPEGIEHPFSPDREPFSLCPGDPRSLEFLNTLYDELLPCFGSSTVNAGLDETIDLGLGRSAEACAERGKQHVYTDFVRKVHDLLARRGKRMQFWADIVLAVPESVADLPPDAIAMAWGYEADHPFERELPILAESGLEYQVCPGTSSWNSIGGRCENALGNLQSATRGALKHGARGVLITDWGDRGHHQPPVVSLFGLVAGLGLAWSASTDHACEDWARLVDTHALGDTGGFLGDALLELGRIDDANDAHALNGSAIFYTLAFALEDWPHERIPGMDAAGAASSARAARALRDRLADWQPPTAEARDVAREIDWAASLLETSARLALARCQEPEAALSDLPGATALAAELEASIEEHREHWLRRSRPGGLDRSIRYLQRVATALRGG